MKLAILAAVAALCSLFGAGDAAAYCVYNKSDRPAYFGSFGGPNFSKTVKPGAKECCPYDKKSCNKGKSHTSDTQMATTIETSSTNLGLGTVTHGFRCGDLMGQGKKQFTEGDGYGYYVQGSGWAELHKNGEAYEVQVYNYDNSRRAVVACRKF